ncbi:MAG TPA: RsmE family RNA methyltransferase [Gemmatimonadaceae bacterium]|nr:RsmE family RNA methyltransferase [Gemmatimonadaceae bacterium]HNV74336.1 RsmE family RNA methyltransferase [Gemmatimonadaceae bacterium]HPV74020.1 RsmE family RNA methyltransferase [Gemmatimonadaceae bacterium]
MEHHDREGVAAFYVPDESFAPGVSASLGEGVLHHVRVRRLGIGSRVALLDGQGHRAEGTLVRLSKAAAIVEVERVESLPSLPPVHLLVPIADRDRMLWLAEKCAELGATSWRPILYRRSRSVKPRGEGPTFAGKLKARMAAALEQSGGGWLPAMYPEATLSRALGALPEGPRLVLDAAGSAILGQRLAPPVTVAVGPEGGLEDEELEEFERAGFTRVALGGHILRFETAAIAGLAIARSAIVTVEGAHGD